MMAAGLTVTVTVNTAPIHMPDEGVILKVAVCDIDVVLVSVLVIVALPVPDTPPVRPIPLVGVPHA